MKYFELSLRHRLLLVLVPSVFALLVNFYDMFGDGIGDTLGVVMFSAYGALFGAFVMAPFITSRSMLVLRFGALVVSPILISVAVTAVYQNLYPPSPWYSSMDGVIRLTDVNFTLLFITLALAFVLFITAPLKVSWKYWIYVALAGLFNTAMFIVWLEWFFCLAGCSWWGDLSPVIPFLVWHLSICVAVYFGRIDVRQARKSAQHSEVV